MTRQAGIAIIDITIHLVMVIISSVQCMTGPTGENSIVIRIWMTFIASIPFIIMLPAVYGEVLVIMIERGRFPGIH